MDEIKEMALHETAHAFVGWYYGMRLKLVTVIGPLDEKVPEDERTPFYCNFYGEGWISNDMISSKDLLTGLNMRLAPAVVGSKRSGSLSYGELWDVFTAMRFVTWQDPTIRALAESAQQIISKNPDDWQESARQFYKKYCGSAQELLSRPKVENTIEVFGEELFQRGCLSGVEAASAFERIWGEPLPKKALPAPEHLIGSRSSSPEDSFVTVLQMTKHCIEELRKYSENEKCERGLNAVLNCFFVLCDINAEGSTRAMTQSLAPESSSPASA